jgi:hemerythrin
MSTVLVQFANLSPEYLVHNVEIDRQNQILFNLAKRLQEAMLLGKGKEILGTILAQMKTHASDYRTYEESFMKTVHDPELRAHVQQCEELERKAKLLLERFEHGETTMTIELASFLSSWIEQHIMRADRRFTYEVNGPTPQWIC